MKESNIFTSAFGIGDKVHVYAEECIENIEKGEDHTEHGFEGVVVKVAFTGTKAWYYILADDDAEVVQVPSELVYPKGHKING